MAKNAPDKDQKVGWFNGLKMAAIIVIITALIAAVIYSNSLA